MDGKFFCSLRDSGTATTILLSAMRPIIIRFRPKPCVTAVSGEKPKLFSTTVIAAFFVYTTVSQQYTFVLRCIFSSSLKPPRRYWFPRVYFPFCFILLNLIPNRSLPFRQTNRHQPLPARLGTTAIQR